MIVSLIELAPVCLPSDKVTMHISHKVLMEVVNNILLIVVNPQGILDELLRPHPINLSNIIQVTLINQIKWYITELFKNIDDHSIWSWKIEQFKWCYTDQSTNKLNKQDI